MAPLSPPRVIVVIVVEDEIMIRLPVVSALEAAAFEVIEAGHSGEALAILEREAVRVHVVFTDVHMPGPMDGLVLAHHVRRHWPSIKIGPITPDLIRAYRILGFRRRLFSLVFRRLHTLAIGFVLSKCFVEPFVCHFGLLSIRNVCARCTIKPP